MLQGPAVVSDHGPCCSRVGRKCPDEHLTPTGRQTASVQVEEVDLVEAEKVGLDRGAVLTQEPTEAEASPTSKPVAFWIAVNRSNGIISFAVGSFSSSA